MRVSRTRFSKRRSKRKTEFPIIAVVQKKRKVESGNRSNLSRFSGMSRKEGSFAAQPHAPSEVKSSSEREKNSSFAKENETSKNETVLKKSLAKERQKGDSYKAQKKSRATIDYKNVILLRNLITAEGKILPRRINKLTAKQQRYVQKAIKSARIMGLVPFINKSRPF